MEPYPVSSGGEDGELELDAVGAASEQLEVHLQPARRRRCARRGSSGRRRVAVLLAVLRRRRHGRRRRLAVLLRRRVAVLLAIQRRIGRRAIANLDRDPRAAPVKSLQNIYFMYVIITR